MHKKHYIRSMKANINLALQMLDDMSDEMSDNEITEAYKSSKLFIKCVDEITAGIHAVPTPKTKQK